ncbi:MAG: ABC transporter ATP-binding protein [bacterium]|nr:ABC transporter ATP-binding protein [bacterium]
MKSKPLPVVEFREVSRVYGNPKIGGEVVKAVDKISFKVMPGEFVAITGPSGSGKSTLLHLIGLLDRPTAGEILIDGVDASKLSDQRLAKLRNQKIGFVFQQFNLLRRTPAIRNVELPLVYATVSASQRRHLAAQMLTKVGLGDRFTHFPSQLSGGQQQRVAIARALVTRPSLLLADEPTGNLDSHSGDEIMKLFTTLHSEGGTIILVTHEPDIAARAKRQIIIKDGKLISDKGKK